MEIIHLTADDFEEKVIRSDVPVVVDFWAEWCGPCRMLAPVIEELAKEHEDIKFAKFDVDSDTSIPLSYGIDSIPALFLFRGGKAEKKCVGYMPKEMIEKNLGI